MAKQLLYTDDARKKLLTGAEKLAHAVGSTLGPTGRNVIIDKSFGGPTVTKDGVTVSKEIELPDPFENMGAKLVNAVAQKTSDVAGDGTTTATILALSIYQEGLRIIAAGANPMIVKSGIDRAVEAAVTFLEGMSKKLSKKEEMEQVASISANNDPVIGKLMADAFDKVGKDGVITVEEGKTSETVLEFVEGMQFDKGYISPYFVTNATDMKCEFEDPLILIYEKKLSNVRDMLPLLEKVAQAAKPLLDHRRGRRKRGAGRPGRQSAAGRLERVRGQGSGLRRSSQGHDGRHCHPDRRAVHQRGSRPEAGKHQSRSARLGQDWCASRRKAAPSSTERARSRTSRSGSSRFETQMEQTESEYDKEKFSERLAKLTGGVAIIRVGAATEADMKQKKARVEDALHATRAAVAEGMLPGGGVALIRAIDSLDSFVKKLDGDERAGAEIVVRALEKPLRIIAENSGLDGAVVADEVRQQKNANIGYNANTGEYVDMFKAGIIDPTKVTRSALQNAASIAGLMLTTEVMITKIDEDEPKNKVVGAIR